MRTAFLIIIALFCLPSCGNNDETQLILLPAAKTSYFGGNWSGTWYASAGNQTRSASLMIDAAGNATGSISDPAGGQPASLSGAVSGDGSASFSYLFTGATYTATCTVNKDTVGHLMGNCDEYFENSQIGTVLFDLIKQT